jgi:hypothetical protein
MKRKMYLGTPSEVLTAVVAGVGVALESGVLHPVSPARIKRTDRRRIIALRIRLIEFTPLFGISATPT